MLTTLSRRPDNPGLMPDVASADQPHASRLELAAGYVGGGVPKALLPAVAHDISPVAALRSVIREGLQRPPCLVSFSGGRDSSVILALAVEEARTQGTPLPVPVTLRFPGLPETVEDKWQERVIRHLGLADWGVTTWVDELDLMGPVAIDTVGSLGGPYWPANAHLHRPLMKLAAGGTLMTGFDGDTIFGAWRWEHAAHLWAGAERPTLRAARQAVACALPPYWRGRIAARHWRPPAWLAEGLHQKIHRVVAQDRGTEPVAWSDRCSWWPRRRIIRLALWTLDRMAALHDVRMSHPFAEEPFLTALAAIRRSRLHGGRTGRMSALFGGTLPGWILTRRTKANLARAVVGPHTRAWLSNDGFTSAMASWPELTPGAAAAIRLDTARGGPSANLVHHLRFSRSD